MKGKVALFVVAIPLIIFGVVYALTQYGGAVPTDLREYPPYEWPAMRLVFVARGLGLHPSATVVYEYTRTKEGHWLAKVIDSDNADFIGDWTKYDGQAIYTYYRRWMREPEKYDTGGRSFELDPILNPYRASALARQLRERAAVMQGRTSVHLGEIARQAVRVERAHPNGIREVYLVDLDLGLVLEWRELVNGETQAYLQIMRMEILPENMSLPQ